MPNFSFFYLPIHDLDSGLANLFLSCLTGSTVRTSGLQTWDRIPALPLISYNFSHINHHVKVIFVPKSNSGYCSNWWSIHLWLAILPGSCTCLTSITWALGSNFDLPDSQFLNISISGSHSPYLFLFWSVTHLSSINYLSLLFLLVSISTWWSLTLIVMFQYHRAQISEYKTETEQVNFHLDATLHSTTEMKWHY